MTCPLSICMPVYNAAEFLPQALDSILRQAPYGLEIVVFDGGSTDSTPELMSAFARRHQQIRYCRSQQRGGIDADMARCAGEAEGRYLWFFSGDDVMRRGAADRALALCSQNADVYLFKHSTCTRSMRVVGAHPVLRPDRQLTVDLSDPRERRIWFQRSATTEAFFSFISTLIVRRDTWERGHLPAEFEGSCWGHVARLFDLSRGGLRVSYVPEIWVDKRGENDSFSDRGMVNRIRIAVDGYHRLADRFWGRHSVEAFHLRKVVRAEMGIRLFLRAKQLCEHHPERESRSLLDGLFRRAFCDGTLAEDLAHLLYGVAPLWLMTRLQAAYRRLGGERLESRLRPGRLPMLAAP